VIEYLRVFGHAGFVVFARTHGVAARKMLGNND